MTGTDLHLDLDTGLPPLRAGYFWRVLRVRNAFGDWLEVQLRRRTWYGSAFVNSAVCDPEPERIRRAAAGILIDRARYLAEDQAMTDLAGDYPPKRLED